MFNLETKSVIASSLGNFFICFSILILLMCPIDTSKITHMLIWCNNHFENIEPTLNNMLKIRSLNGLMWWKFSRLLHLHKSMQHTLHSVVVSLVSGPTLLELYLTVVSCSHLKRMPYNLFFYPPLIDQSSFNDTDQNILAFPAWLGGLSILIHRYYLHIILPHPLIWPQLSQIYACNLNTSWSVAHNRHKQWRPPLFTELLAILPAKQKRYLEIAGEKGLLHGMILLYTRVLLEMLSVYAMANYGWQPITITS